MSRCRSYPKITHRRDGQPLPLLLPVIAFGHQSRVGKDTAAQGAFEAVPTAERFAFADALKGLCAQLFGRYGLRDREFYELRPDLRNEPVYVSSGMTPTEVWVHVGKAMREVHADVWVDWVLKQTRLDPVDLILISDLRFPNEARAVRRVGGLCVKVVRPDAALPVHGADNEFDATFRWDAVLVNDGSAQDLKRKAGELALDYVYGTDRSVTL